MNDIVINIAKEFTESPGGRYKKDGLHSGEEFLETILIPKVKQAIKDNQNITINLDGGYGYPTSFLEEVFTNLVKDFKTQKILKMINIISEDEPSLVLDIERYMKNALRTIEKEKLL
jgi:hypothetical protein